MRMFEFLEVSAAFSFYELKGTAFEPLSWLYAILMWFVDALMFSFFWLIIHAFPEEPECETV